MKLSGKKGTEQSKKKSVGKAKKVSEVIKVPGDWLYMEFLRLECQMELL